MFFSRMNFETHILHFNIRFEGFMAFSIFEKSSLVCNF